MPSPFATRTEELRRFLLEGPEGATAGAVDPRFRTIGQHGEALREDFNRELIEPETPNPFRRFIQNLASVRTQGAIPPVESATFRDLSERDLASMPEGVQERFARLTPQERALALAENPDRLASLSAEQFDRLVGAVDPRSTEGKQAFDLARLDRVAPSEEAQGFFRGRMAQELSPSGPFITFRNPEDESDIVTTRRDSPVADALANQGYVEVKTPAAEVNVTSNVDLSERAKGELDVASINTRNARDRLSSIKDSFDPELQTVLSRWQSAGLTVQNALQGFPGVPELSEDQRKFVEDVTRLQTRTLDNLNTTLNELSGAAVSQQEFNRISRQLPNPEDAPIKFETKLNDAITQMDVALARRTIWDQMAQGEKPAKPWNVNRATVANTLTDALNQAKETIQSQNPGLSDVEATERAMAIVERSFGITNGNVERVLEDLGVL